MKNFYLQHENIFILPVLHYKMEFALEAKRAFEELKPDCVAVELPEDLSSFVLRAVDRLPDISVVQIDSSLYIPCEPCDASMETLRSAREVGADAFCIDLDVVDYPSNKEAFPDSYALVHIGLQSFYEAYEVYRKRSFHHPLDLKRELYMAKRLKELSYCYEKVFFVCGLSHAASILEHLKESSFPSFTHETRSEVTLCTLTEESLRESMGECGWITLAYEEWRKEYVHAGHLDRQRLIFHLYKVAAESYTKNTGHPFKTYLFRTLMKFARNYSLIHLQLMPDLYKILTCAKSCVDANFAYEVWAIATEYPLYKNVDNLPELGLKAEELWGRSKQIRFQLKQKSRKASEFKLRKKEQKKGLFSPPSPFSICSYPPEDLIVERFGSFLRKKGNVLLSEEAARTIPFQTSLEEGVDLRETIRNWHEKKIYVKTKGRPPGAAGSVVVIFDEDNGEENASFSENFPWKTTWIGEHTQESDMAFYATSMRKNIVGPGISRCEYGGFMMSSPPRRLMDVWSDPDYSTCQTKAEVLLIAAIDYAVKPLIVYVAKKPPRMKIKNFAARFGKKIVYLPIGQLSPQLLNKIRIFHVLDSHGKREIAGDYIF